MQIRPISGIQNVNCSSLWKYKLYRVSILAEYLFSMTSKSLRQQDSQLTGITLQYGQETAAEAGSIAVCGILPVAVSSPVDMIPQLDDRTSLQAQCTTQGLLWKHETAARDQKYMGPGREMESYWTIQCGLEDMPHVHRCVCVFVYIPGNVFDPSISLNG